MPRKPVEVQASPVSVDPTLVRKGLRLLRNAGETGLSKEDLANGLGDGEPVSNKTVERFLKSLRDDGAVISDDVRDRERRKRFVLEKGPKWDEHVTAEARLAFELACMILNQSGTLLWQEKVDTIQKLLADENRTTQRDRELFEQLKKSVRVFGGVEDPKESSEILEPLLKALRNNHVVKVSYQAAGKAEPISMEVFPRALTHDLFSGGAYLLVWDPAHHIPKQLRLNRIDGVTHLRRRGAVTHPEMMERALDYQIGSWVSGDEPFEVKVRIRGRHWVQALDDAPPALPEFEAQPSKDGQTLTATFKANAKQGVLRWVLQFGRCAEVLEPVWLRDEIKNELKESLKAYA